MEHILVGMSKKCREFCRYTSLASFFHIIESQQHCMCCIEGMNDTTEVDWMDRQLNVEMRDIEIYSKSTNNIFILSLCEKDMEDDLTMWRLYGDDTKGVCLVYDVKDSLPDGFLLKKVDYEMQTLKTLSSIIDNIDNFEYKGINDTWKHFLSRKNMRLKKNIVYFMTSQRVILHYRRSGYIILHIILYIQSYYLTTYMLQIIFLYNSKKSF